MAIGYMVLNIVAVEIFNRNIPLICWQMEEALCDVTPRVVPNEYIE